MVCKQFLWICFTNTNYYGNIVIMYLFVLCRGFDSHKNDEFINLNFLMSLKFEKSVFLLQTMHSSQNGCPKALCYH
jgi:hypothetical protein